MTHGLSRKLEAEFTSGFGDALLTCSVVSFPLGLARIQVGSREWGCSGMMSSTAGFSGALGCLASMVSGRWGVGAVGCFAAVGCTVSSGR